MEVFLYTCLLFDSACLLFMSISEAARISHKNEFVVAFVVLMK